MNRIPPSDEPHCRSARLLGTGSSRRRLLASACGSDDATSSPTPAPATDAAAISEAPAATQAPTTTTEAAAARGPNLTRPQLRPTRPARTLKPAPDRARISVPADRLHLPHRHRDCCTQSAQATGVVAVDEYSYYPPEGTPVTDLSGWNPNIEAIVSYDPDLVIMGTDGDVDRQAWNRTGIACARPIDPLHPPSTTCTCPDRPVRRRRSIWSTKPTCWLISTMQAARSAS